MVGSAAVCSHRRHTCYHLCSRIVLVRIRYRRICPRSWHHENDASKPPLINLLYFQICPETKHPATRHLLRNAYRLPVTLPARAVSYLFIAQGSEQKKNDSLCVRGATQIARNYINGYLSFRLDEASVAVNTPCLPRNGRNQQSLRIRLTTTMAQIKLP